MVEADLSAQHTTSKQAPMSHFELLCLTALFRTSFERSEKRYGETDKRITTLSISLPLAVSLIHILTSQVNLIRLIIRTQSLFNHIIA